MNRFLEQVPRPVLVLVVLCLALVFIVLNDPLKDECEVQTKVFERNTKGLLRAARMNKKIQYAKIDSLKEICRTGNSIGSCADYFEILRKVTVELRSFSEKCQLKYIVETPSLVGQIASSLKTMALVAWGDAPPMGPEQRLGWLVDADVKTFCGLKKTYQVLAGEEAYLELQNQIFSEFPDAWPEQLLPKKAGDEDLRNPLERPLAFKSTNNPSGKFSFKEIFSRSLFSVPCNQNL